MKTPNKIAFLISGVMLALILMLMGYQYIRDREIDLYLQSKRISDGQVIDKVLEFQTRNYLNPVIDNAAWDDMYNFIDTRDIVWGIPTLESTRFTFSMNYLGVFDKSGKYILDVHDSLGKNITFSKSEIKSWFHTQRTPHHFKRINNKIYEIFGCVVVPTKDYTLASPEKGYLVAAVEWNDDYIRSVEKATGFEVSILSLQEDDHSIIDGEDISRPLLDASGHELAVLRFLGTHPFQKELKMLKSLALVGLGVILLIFLFLIHITNRWVARPLRDITRSLSEGSVKPIYHLLGKKGSYGDIARLIRRFNEQNVALLIEVDERKLAEEKVKKMNESLEERVNERTAELEETLSEQEAFSYTVSHDLRSPLRAIDGYALFLAEEFSDVLNDDAKKYLFSIRKNSDKMARLIDGLVGFTQLNRTRIRCGMVDTKALVQHLLNTYMSDNDKQRYEILIDNLPAVSADPTLMSTMWQNLITNALKFTAREEHPQIHIAYEMTSSEIIYSIKDNGIGFNMRYYNKLFGVFQKLHDDPDFSGTGVGLALVKRIVQKHGGRVWAESAEGEGATFYVAMPVAQKIGGS